MTSKSIHKSWFDPRASSAGMWAFLIHRLSGLGLVAYLFLHLALLNLLRGGPGQWDAFIALARSPLFLALDVLLLAGVLLHALNGLRLAILGLGGGWRYQKQTLWLVLFLSAGLLGWGTIEILAR